MLARYGLTRERLIGMAILVVLLPVSARAGIFTTDGDDTTSRIRFIIDGPWKQMYVAGWGLLGLGLVIGTGWEQLRSFGGQPPNHAQVLSRALVSAAALGCYVPFCKSVWNVSAYLAQTITSPDQVNWLSLCFKTLIAQAFTFLGKDQGPLLGLVSIARNGLLALFMDFLLFGVSFVTDGIRVLQVSVFNVVFMFGPICLALHVMGFRTGQLWLTALLEVCAWNITIAIVTYGVVYRVETQIVKNAQAGALEFDWWRDMKEVTFLAGLILFVPALTSRFFGFAALGELSRAALGSNLDMAVGRTLLSLGSWRSAPHLSERSTLGDGSDRDDRRAGD